MPKTRKIPQSFCIAHLPQQQRHALQKILDTIAKGKKIRVADAGLLGFSFSHCRHKETCEFYHISVRSLYKWIDQGCPRNDDETYDLFKIHEWLLKESEPNKVNLKEQKLEQEIQKLKILNAKLEEKYIDRKEHENILNSRAASLRNFIERSLTMNRPARSMRSVEELVAVDYEFLKQMLDAYIGK